MKWQILLAFSTLLTSFKILFLNWVVNMVNNQEEFYKQEVTALFFTENVQLFLILEFAHIFINLILQN